MGSNSCRSGALLKSIPGIGVFATYPKSFASIASTLLLALVITLAGCGGLDSGVDKTPGRSGGSEQGPLTGPVLLVAVLDVGQADAIIVKAPSGKSMLVDAGNGAEDVRRTILPFLKQQGISQLDYAVLTHPDQDHVGGMPAVLSSLKVDAFVDSVQPGVTNNAYRDTLQLVRDKRIKAVKARYGKTSVDLGPEVQVQVLGPEDPLLEKGDSVENNNSVVLRLTYGKVSYLLTGDIESEAEERILGYKVDIRSQILKVAHHGSRYTTSDKFLDAVKPEVALISAGADNRYGHPHKETLNRLDKRGVKVFRTDLKGSILVRSDGERYSIETSK